MICYIDISTAHWAQKVLEIQMHSYAVEAEIIGFAELPPLKDTIETLQQSGETFYGFFIESVLAGAISYERKGEKLFICRMMVQPNFFRQGIASALIRFVLDLEKDAKEAIVTTGSQNLPAINLYKRHGFREMEKIEVAKGVYIAKFVRINKQLKEEKNGDS